MRQAPGTRQDVPIVDAEPNDGDDVGADMTLFAGAAKVWKYALWVQITGGTSCDLDLWVRRPDDNTWAAASFGSLGTALTPKRRVYNLENLGIFDRILVVRSNNVGTTGAAQLQEFIENNFMRGD